MRETAKTMTLHLNAAEYAHLCQQAEVTGLKKEPLVRQLIMGVKLRPRPPNAYADLLRALSAIGNNINQLAPIRPTQGGQPPRTKLRKPCFWCGRPRGL